MAITEGKYPLGKEGWTPELLTGLVERIHPGTSVTDCTVVDGWFYGSEQASTSGRLALDLRYAGAEADKLPARAICKIAQTVSSAEALYANEVRFYRQLQPELASSAFSGPGLEIETPLCVGGDYDAASGTYALVLEDLGQRGVTFPSVRTSLTLPQLRNMLAMLARLHGHYWQSPRFAGDLSWVESHVAGDLHTLFHSPDGTPGHIAHLVETIQFKREMVQRLGMSVDELFDSFKKVQHHQARLPQTLLHGDTHIGNTYLLPGDKMGLLDWQLSVRGYCMHDVSYIIATALPVEMRRKHERELLAFYRECLVEAGVREAPSAEELWLEYRRAMVWNVYIGWLTTDITNYGWEICVLAHLRVMTAFEDMETAKLLRGMD